jgi:hypothetical protein
MSAGAMTSNHRASGGVFGGKAAMPTIAIAARIIRTIAVRIFSEVAHGAENRWQELMRRLETRRAGKSRGILRAFPVAANGV